MLNKSKIKIVKRTDAAAVKAKNKKPKNAGPRTAAREMVSTVTVWVSDLKQRKGQETKAAFDMLFANRRPNES